MPSTKGIEIICAGPDVTFPTVKNGTLHFVIAAADDTDPDKTVQAMVGANYSVAVLRGADPAAMIDYARQAAVDAGKPVGLVDFLAHGQPGNMRFSFASSKNMIHIESEAIASLLRMAGDVEWFADARIRLVSCNVGSSAADAHGNFPPRSDGRLLRLAIARATGVAVEAAITSVDVHVCKDGEVDDAAWQKLIGAPTRTGEDGSTCVDADAVFDPSLFDLSYAKPYSTPLPEGAKADADTFRKALTGEAVLMTPTGYQRTVDLSAVAHGLPETLPVAAADGLMSLPVLRLVRPHRSWRLHVGRYDKGGRVATYLLLLDRHDGAPLGAEIPAHALGKEIGAFVQQTLRMAAPRF